MADLKRRIIAEFSAKNKAKGEMASFRKDMDDTGQAMMRMAKGALAMVGLGGGLYAAKRGFDYVTKAAMKQEDAVFLLEAALKAVGEYTVEAMEGFEAFAASIQKATVYGDEEVLALMQLMKSLGVTSSKLEQATRMAIGLAAATGRDVKSMSMYIALAQQGEFTMLRRYIPALRSTTDATEQLRIVTEFAANGFKIAEAQAETTSGALSQLWNAVSDLAEVAGKPILEPMAEDAGNLTIIIEGATGALKKFEKEAEQIRKTREKFGLRPMGFPRVPMPDLEKRFERRETPESEAEALLKAAEEFHEIEMARAEERKKQAIQDALDALKRMDKSVAASVDASLKRIEAEDAAAKEIDKIWTEHWLKEEKKAYHAMRAPIIEAERLAEESAERRKRIAEDIALSMASSWSNAMDQMMFESKKFWDAMKDMARSLLREITRIIMYKQVAEKIAYGIMGGEGKPGLAERAFTAGVSALFGAGGGSAAAKAEAPYVAAYGAPWTTVQHGGEVMKTGLAVIHKGEKYSGVGGGGNLDVHIHNEGEGKFEISEVEEYAISDQRIIDVTIRAAAENGPYRRSIRQTSR